jgi:hypothetical protein
MSETSRTIVVFISSQPAAAQTTVAASILSAAGVGAVDARDVLSGGVSIGATDAAVIITADADLALATEVASTIRGRGALAVAAVHVDDREEGHGVRDRHAALRAVSDAVVVLAGPALERESRATLLVEALAALTGSGPDGMVEIADVRDVIASPGDVMVVTGHGVGPDAAAVAARATIADAERQNEGGLVGASGVFGTVKVGSSVGLMAGQAAMKMVLGAAEQGAIAAWIVTVDGPPDHVRLICLAAGAISGWTPRPTPSS